ncbi:MAG: hypothetical protein HOY71_11565, partial [Nonomuraea sp.]|nr:hypothetical protein [Nonomuraea sp.]
LGSVALTLFTVASVMLIFVELMRFGSPEADSLSMSFLALGGLAGLLGVFGFGLGIASTVGGGGRFGMWLNVANLVALLACLAFLLTV